MGLIPYLPSQRVPFLISMCTAHAAYRTQYHYIHDAVKPANHSGRETVESEYIAGRETVDSEFIAGEKLSIQSSFLYIAWPTKPEWLSAKRV
jgi:hypothetical protein